MIRKFAIRVVVVLGAMLFALMLGEGILRLSGVWVGRNSDTMFTVMGYDSDLGWRMKPNTNQKVSFVDVENIPVRANSLGFRDAEFKVAKDPLKRRVAFLGDSFTWGMGVQENERFSDLLPELMPNTESLNFGIPGFGTDQEMLVWEQIAERYHPDVVVLTVYQNDYADNTFVIRAGRRKPYFDWHEGSTPLLVPLDANASDFWRDGIYSQAAPPYAAVYPRPVEYRSRTMHQLVKYSDLARLAYTLLRRGYEGETGPSPQNTVGRKIAKRVADLPRTQQVEVGLMDVLLRKFSAEVTASGVQFLVVLAGTPNINFDVQKGMLESAHLRYLDATSDGLATKLPGGIKDLYFPYNKHWTAAGHRVVAEMLAEALREEKQ